MIVLRRMAVTDSPDVTAMSAFLASCPTKSMKCGFTAQPSRSSIANSIATSDFRVPVHARHFGALRLRTHSNRSQKQQLTSRLCGTLKNCCRYPVLRRSDVQNISALPVVASKDSVTGDSRWQFCSNRWPDHRSDTFPRWGLSVPALCSDRQSCQASRKQLCVCTVKQFQRSATLPQPS